MREQLGAPPKARRADLRPLRQVGERPVPRADNGVSRIEALRDGRKHKPRGQLRRHILQAVHSDIDLARKHRLLQLLREKPLAADLRQRCIEHPVALRRHTLLDNRKLRVSLPELRLYVIRLP